VSFWTSVASQLLSGVAAQRCPDAPPDNSCDATDVQKLTNANKDNPVYCQFASKLAKCGFQGILGETPYRNCMRTEMAISDGCIRCFYCDMHCALEKCQNARCTTNPTGPDCIKCSEENCSPALTLCVGVPKSQLPPATPPPLCSA